MTGSTFLVIIAIVIFFSIWYRTRSYPNKKYFFLSVGSVLGASSLSIGKHVFGVSSEEDTALNTVLLIISVLSFGLFVFFINKYWHVTHPDDGIEEGPLLACPRCDGTFYGQSKTCPHCGKQLTEVIVKKRQ